MGGRNKNRFGAYGPAFWGAEPGLRDSAEHVVGRELAHQPAEGHSCTVVYIQSSRALSVRSHLVLNRFVFFVFYVFTSKTRIAMLFENPPGAQLFPPYSVPPPILPLAPPPIVG